MKNGYLRNMKDTELAAATLIDYIMVSGVIMVLFVIMLLLVNTNIMENPANRVLYVSFTDIGNGVSTRMVDIYAVAPANGTIDSKFDIPDEIVGRSYYVEINPGGEGGVDQVVVVSRGDSRMDSTIALAGIGASSKGSAGGSTTGAGINRIGYNSSGYD